MSIQGNQAFLLDKFMLGTALSLTLSLLCVWLALLIRARRGRWHRASSVAAVMTMTGLLYLHMVIGGSVMFASVVVIGLLLLVRARTDPGGPSYERLLTLCAISVAFALPYLLSIRARGEGHALVQLAIAGPAQWTGLLADILPALVLAVPFLRWTERQDKRELLTGRLFGELSLSATGMVVFFSAAVAVLAVTVDLVANNETKFAFVVFVPLAALAAGGLARAWRSRAARWLALVFVAAATIPLHAVYFSHAWRDTTTLDIPDEESAVYEWIRSHTPADALFIDHAETVRVPVLGARDQYFGIEAYARNWGYATGEVNARRALRDSVYAAGGVTAAQRSALRALRRPVYVISRQLPGDPTSADKRFSENRLYRGRFPTPDVVVFEMMLEEE